MSYREFFKDWISNLSEEDWKAIGSTPAFYKEMLETVNFVFNNEYLHIETFVECLTQTQF